MRTKSRASLPLLALAPVFLAAGGPLDAPSYHPKAGTVMAKEFTSESELELRDSRVELDGVDMSEMAGQVEMAMKISMKLGVVDEYVATEAGLPTRLKRTFDEIASTTHVSQTHPMMGSNEQDIPLSSQLEGSTVKFDWDADDSSWKVAFEGEGGDDALLEGLQEDIDLRGFLPHGEVSKGDTWEIPEEAVRSALAPGGDLKLRPEDDDNPMSGMNQVSPSDMVGELEGEFQATYQGTREEDGVTVAVIHVALKGSSAQDLTSRLKEMQEQMKDALPEGIGFDLTAMDMEYELEAEGEILWDMEAGLVHGMSISGETRLIMDMSVNVQRGDQDSSMETSQTFEGTQTLTLTVGD